MNKLIAFTLGFILTGFFVTVLADSEEYDLFETSRLQSSGVAKVENALYQAECGSCHFAYQPGWLPGRSWRKIMTGLEDHFGDNAELAQEDRAMLNEYLLSNAADVSGYRRSVSLMKSLDNQDAPLRITEVPYIVRKHRGELPADVFSQKQGVTSLSQCDSCHKRAEQGSFREGEIRIPGYARWDD